MFDFDEDEVIEHVGKDHIESSEGIGSGRYRYGSGENPYQHESWYQGVQTMRKSGMTDTEICKELNITRAEFKSKISQIETQARAINIETALKLQAQGYGATAIAREMGIKSEATVRGWLKAGAADRANIMNNTAEILKEQVKDGSFLNVSLGTEHYIGVTNDRLSKTLKMLEKEEGYALHTVNVEQLGTGHTTKVKVLCPPGTTWAEAQNNFDKIHIIEGVHLEENGRTKVSIHEPERIQQSRIYFKYAEDEDSGSKKDGLIELRRGVDDLDLGLAHYAQVRIGVDGEDGGKYYLKGMALYSDNIPDGYDIIVNSSKSAKKGPVGSMKPYQGDDPLNPFAATINRQSGALNIVREEGEWDTWSKSLASQFLSKQTPQLISRQLNLTIAGKQEEFDEIMRITNPTVRMKMLETFADDCDASAVSLKAAALPRQTTRVLLPIPSLKDNEIYAPHLEQGEECVLVRYPHEGTFEIPRLVNNKNNKEGKAVLGNMPKDAIGVNPTTASKLSGADFDGDTCLVIPTRGVNIVTDSAHSLANFDNRGAYPAKPGMKHMGGKEAADKFNKDNPEYGVKPGAKTDMEMGKISNLITDMTLQGAPWEHLERATKHAMVVIDAQKHHLDYKQSEIDNDIAELRRLYQPGKEGKPDGGARTIISKSKGQATDSLREDRYSINKETGEKEYKYYKDKEPDPTTMSRKHYVDKNTGEIKEESSLYYVNDKGYTVKSKAWYLKNGKITERTTSTTKMEAAKDAKELIGVDNPKEYLYADYANSVKDLGNKARKAMLMTKEIDYDSGAATKYKSQVESLNKKLQVAEMNKPKENQAQMIAGSKMRMILQDNPALKEDNEKLGKEKARQLKYARNQVGAGKVQIEIDDDEWEAIQNGAISKTKLRKIVDNANQDRLKELATPRTNTVSLSPSQISMAKAMLNSGNTSYEVAERFGVSPSTLFKLIG